MRLSVIGLMAQRQSARFDRKMSRALERMDEAILKSEAENASKGRLVPSKTNDLAFVEPYLEK